MSSPALLKEIVLVPSQITPVQLNYLFQGIDHYLARSRSIQLITGRNTSNPVVMKLQNVTGVDAIIPISGKPEKWKSAIDLKKTGLILVATVPIISYLAEELFPGSVLGELAPDKVVMGEYGRQSPVMYPFNFSR